jgi:hypothetical protein
MLVLGQKNKIILVFKSYVNFYRGPYRPVFGPRSWELSCKSRITVPLQKLEKNGISGFLRIPAGKCNLDSHPVRVYSRNSLSR